MFLAMIDSTSLSAFSASNLRPASGAGAIGSSGPVQPVRSVQSAPAAASTSNAQGLSLSPDQLPPGQTLPRGSLLNLSV